MSCWSIAQKGKKNPSACNIKLSNLMPTPLGGFKLFFSASSSGCVWILCFWMSFSPVSFFSVSLIEVKEHPVPSSSHHFSQQCFPLPPGGSWGVCKPNETDNSVRIPARHSQSTSDAQTLIWGPNRRQVAPTLRIKKLTFIGARPTVQKQLKQNANWKNINNEYTDTLRLMKN